VCLYQGCWHELGRDHKNNWVGKEQPDIHEHNLFSFTPERLEGLPEYQEDDPQKSITPEETCSEHSLHSDKSIVSKQNINLHIQNAPLPTELSPVIASAQTTT
jgi:hypothetical protein